MGSKAQAKASSEWASAAKKKGSPIRKTGACPMGCGASITNGGTALVYHLGVCKGKRR